KEAERRAKRESDSGSPDSDQTSSAQSDPEHATGEDSGLQNMRSGAQVTQHSAESGGEVLRFEQETEHND
ncbi:TetR/AcrR family transcriptional regulator, partial [Bifidobacterium longum]